MSSYLSIFDLFDKILTTARAAFNILLLFKLKVLALLLSLQQLKTLNNHFSNLKVYVAHKVFGMISPSLKKYVDHGQLVSEEAN